MSRTVVAATATAAAAAAIVYVLKRRREQRLISADDHAHPTLGFDEVLHVLSFVGGSHEVLRVASTSTVWRDAVRAPSLWRQRAWGHWLGPIAPPRATPLHVALAELDLRLESVSRGAAHADESRARLVLAVEQDGVRHLPCAEGGRLRLRRAPFRLIFALHRTRFPWVAAHVSDAPSVFEAAERGVRLGELRQFHAGRAFDAEAEDIYDAVAMWEGGGGGDVGVFLSDSLHQIWAWEQHALDGRLPARGGVAPPEAVQVHAHDVQFVKRGDAPIDERRWEDVEATRFDALHLVIVLMDASVSNSKQLTNRRELQRECVRVELE